MGKCSGRWIIAGLAVAFIGLASANPSSQQNPSSAASQANRGINAMIPPGHLHVIGLLIRDTGDKLPDVINWYETVHSREAAYQWAFETRYARNYITKVDQGPKPPYRVVLELGYKSQEAADKLRTLMKSGLANPKNNSLAEQAQKWGFIRNIYGVMFPVEVIRIKGAPAPSDPNAPLPRSLILLRRASGASQVDFEGAVKKLGRAIGRLGTNVGVTIDFRRGGPTSRDAPDAIVFIDNAQSTRLPRLDGRAAIVMNAFSVEMLKSPVEMAAP
jgi:hypothetical protein